MASWDDEVAHEWMNQETTYPSCTLDGEIYVVTSVFSILVDEIQYERSPNQFAGQMISIKEG